MALVCVTGASSGIGKEFAFRFSQKGYDLILVARDRARLDTVADQCRTHCEIILCDLAREEEVLRLASYLKQKELAYFINCAGFGDIGLFDETDLSNSLRMIDVNVRAVHILTHEVIAQMKARNKGYLVNVASVAGLMPGGPLMATYYATKAYVVSLTNAVAQELADTGSRVRISALCPGPVDTGFNEVAHVRFALPGISAQRCVTACLSAMQKQKRIIIPGIPAKLSALSARIVPWGIVLHFVRKAQQKKLT